MYVYILFLIFNIYIYTFIFIYINIYIYNLSITYIDGNIPAEKLKGKLKFHIYTDIFIYAITNT